MKTVQQQQQQDEDRHIALNHDTAPTQSIMSPIEFYASTWTGVTSVWLVSATNVSE